MNNINITAGECLNKILTDKYPNECFIPFNEAFIKGDYSDDFFSDEFILKRLKVHGVSKKEYTDKLKGFLNLLNSLNEVNEINLYFGDDEFCLKNKEVVILTLKKFNYKGLLVSHVVDEVSGEIINKENIDINNL